MSASKLGRMQLRILQVLWKKGKATAREITDALNESEDVAHSTVQTLLRKLEAKGAVGHGIEERTFVFRPLVKPETVTRRATRELVERLFGGSAAGLVAYLLKSERIPAAELDEIRRLIDAAEAPGRKNAARRGKED